MTTKTDNTQERAAFEAWHERLYGRRPVRKGGAYAATAHTDRWAIWLACRAAVEADRQGRGEPVYAAPQPTEPETNDAAVSAIQFALETDEGIPFLRCWNEGNFNAIRREWPEAPESVFIGADPMHPETRALLTRYGSGQPVAWMTADGRVATDDTKRNSMSSPSREAFCIPLVAINTVEPKLDTPAASAEPAASAKPSGYAYYYPGWGIRFNDGREVNGCKPTETLPYWLGAAPVAQVPVMWASPETLEAMALHRQNNFPAGGMGLACRAGSATVPLYAAPVAAQAQRCNHVFEARPIDGSTSANVSCEPVCRKCGYRPAVHAAKGATL